MVDRDQVFKMLKMEVLNSSRAFLAPRGSPKLCHKLKSAYREAAAAWWK